MKLNTVSGPLEGINADLWRTTANFACSNVIACKVKAHRSLQEDTDDEDFKVWLGNAVADAAAGAAATKAQLPDLTREALSKVFTVAYLTAVRMAVAESVARRRFQQLAVKSQSHRA